MNYYSDNLSTPSLRILRCNYYQRVPFWEYSVVQQPFWLLMRNRQEGAFLTANDQTLPMRLNYYYLLPPYTPYKTHKEVRFFDQLYVQFTTGKSLGRVPSELIVLPARENNEEFFAELTQAPTCFFEEFLKLKFYSVVYDVLCQLLNRKDFFSPEPWMDTRILELVELINAAPGKRYSNLQLSRRANMSENNLMRVFRRALGMTPQQYIVNQRVRHAAQLLIESMESIESIASTCGFANRYHFSKVFSRLIGKPPGAVRRAARQGREQQE
jgi:AraC-like DNA-binding protein